MPFSAGNCSLTNPPLLITGCCGTLGQAFRWICHIRGLEAVCLDRAALDIADAAAIARALDCFQPWAELARHAAQAAGLDTAGIVARPAASFGWAAMRPGCSALRSHQGVLLPSLESALQRYLVDEQLLQSPNPPAAFAG